VVLLRAFPFSNLGEGKKEAGDGPVGTSADDDLVVARVTSETKKG